MVFKDFCKIKNESRLYVYKYCVFGLRVDGRMIFLVVVEISMIFYILLIMFIYKNKIYVLYR